MGEGTFRRWPDGIHHIGEPETQRKKSQMNDVEFLKWLQDRLVHVYKESPNTDFVHRLGEITKRFEGFVTLEQGYKVIEDQYREAHDRWKDKSE